MKKLLGLSLLSIISGALALNNTNESSTYNKFQQFDRQYNLGFGFTSGSLSNSKANSGTNNTQFINLEVERLFNIGVWLNANANLLTYYSQRPDPATPATGNLTGSDPQFGGINAKVGYAFILINHHLLITPYGMGGRNVNLSSYTLSNNYPTTNITQDYFWTVGAGARLEYRINQYLDFYLDQNMVYNASEAPVAAGFSPNNNYVNASTLGIKYNAYKNLQLGAKVYYNNYYYTQSLTTADGGNAMVPTNQVGGLISVGLTY